MHDGSLDAEEYACDLIAAPQRENALTFEDIREWTLEQLAELIFEDLGPAEATAERVNLS